VFFRGEKVEGVRCRRGVEGGVELYGIIYRREGKDTCLFYPRKKKKGNGGI